VANNGVYDRVAVNVQSVSVMDSQSNMTMTAGLPVRMMLDTGNFDIKLPSQFVQAVQSAFNIKTQVPLTRFNFSVCSCALANSPGAVNLGLGQVNITVPVKSLVTTPPASILQALKPTST
jgi:hypothetical protein